MLRVILLLVVLGVAHCHWGGFHDHNHSGPDDFNDSGPSFEHHHGPGHGHGHGHGHGWGHGDWGGCGPEGCHRPGAQNTTWHSAYDRRFQRLSDYVIRADRFYKEFCDRFTPGNVQESYENSVYTLTYSMPQLDPANIAVKIKHRVLYMYAKQSDAQDSPTYVDVKVLPATLKISEAAWTYDTQQLVVTIPDDPTLLVKTEKKCVDLNVEVKDVPQRSLIIYKFGTKDETIQ